MANLFRANARVARLLIQRTGEPVEIYRPDGSASENKYGKILDEDVSYYKVADELARRIYEGSDNEPGYGEVTGGRVDTDSPRIAFFTNTETEVGDIIQFPDGKSYVLDESYDRKTHMLYRTTLTDDAEFKSYDSSFGLIL